jgi:spermidine synthase
LGVVAVLGSPQLYSKTYEKLLLRSKYKPTNRFAHVIENRHGVITVTRDRKVYGGGAYDGVINVGLMRDRNSVVRAYSVAALHPAPREALMVGLSSGPWAQVISHLPGVHHLTVVEINPGYLELIRRYPQVRSLLENPKVSIEIDDGRRWLRRNPGRTFDVVVQNTTWHWRAHVSNLLSAEYLDLVRAHLRPGGIFYYNTTRSLDVLRTAVAKFPYVLGVSNFVAVSDTPFRFDATRWRNTLEQTTIDGVPTFELDLPEHRETFDELRKLADLAPHVERNGYLERRSSIERRTRTAAVVTDDNMICEWRKLIR